MLLVTAVAAHGVIHSSSCQDSNEILGTCSEIIASTARYIFDVVKSEGPSRLEGRMSKSCAVQSRPRRKMFRANCADILIAAKAVT